MAEINDRLQKIVNERFSGNQTSFANAIGVPQTSIANYLSKRASKPSFEVLALMVEKLGVDARWLLTGKEYALNGVNATDSPVAGSSVVDSQIFIGVPSEIKDMVLRYETTLKEKMAQMEEKERIIAEKERAILDKDERISDLKERISELKSQITSFHK